MIWTQLKTVSSKNVYMSDIFFTFFIRLVLFVNMYRTLLDLVTCLLDPLPDQPANSSQVRRSRCHLLAEPECGQSRRIGQSADITQQQQNHFRCLSVQKWNRSFRSRPKTRPQLCPKPFSDYSMIFFSTRILGMNTELNKQKLEFKCRIKISKLIKFELISRSFILDVIVKQKCCAKKVVFFPTITD